LHLTLPVWVRPRRPPDGSSAQAVDSLGATDGRLPDHSSPVPRLAGLGALALPAAGGLIWVRRTPPEDD
jgi:hypothetical protein